MRVIETDYSIKCGREAFDLLVQSDGLPTLIICGNDVLAVGAVLEAREIAWMCRAMFPLSGLTT